MGDEARYKRARKNHHVEVVDVGDRRVESRTILQHFAARTDLVGCMVIAELPNGGISVKYTGASNIAERLGRLEILKDMLLDEAEEYDA